MPNYHPGQKVIAQIEWDGETRMRNVRIEGPSGPGLWIVRVRNRQFNYWYSNTLVITESAIHETVSGSSW